MLIKLVEILCSDIGSVLWECALEVLAVLGVAVGLAGLGSWGGGRGMLLSSWCTRLRGVKEELSLSFQAWYVGSWLSYTELSVKVELGEGHWAWMFNRYAGDKPPLTEDPS